MVGTPAAMPVITPVLASTVPRAVLLLLHEPPEIVLVNVVCEPAQTEVAPAITSGSGLTVTSVMALQPGPVL